MTERTVSFDNLSFFGEEAIFVCKLVGKKRGLAGTSHV